MAGLKYDIYRVERTKLPVKFVAGEMEEIHGGTNSFVTCRAVKDGRIGYYGSNVATVEELVSKAAANAEFGQPVNFSFPGPASLRDVKVYSEKAAAWGVAELAGWGRRVVERIRQELGPEVVINVTAEKEERRRAVVNSEGVDYRHAATGVSLVADVTDAREGDIHEVFDVEFGWQPEDVDVDRLIRSVCDYYRAGKEPTTVPTGKATVILHPFCVYQFLLPVLIALNGDRVKDGSSPLVDQVGREILSEALTLYDDPFWPASSESAPFDAEGVVASRRTLIANGVLQGFNHTLETAAAVGHAAGGGADRNDDGKAEGGFFNVMLKPGQGLSSDLVASSDGVLFLRYLSGSGQANALAGEFSMGTYSAFLIEKGRLAKRLKKTMISGNVYDVLKKVEAVTEDGLKGIGPGAGWFPFIMLKDVPVASE